MIAYVVEKPGIVDCTDDTAATVDCKRRSPFRRKASDFSEHICSRMSRKIDLPAVISNDDTRRILAPSNTTIEAPQMTALPVNGEWRPCGSTLTDITGTLRCEPNDVAASRPRGHHSLNRHRLRVKHQKSARGSHKVFGIILGISGNFAKCVEPKNDACRIGCSDPGVFGRRTRSRKRPLPARARPSKRCLFYANVGSLKGMRDRDCRFRILQDDTLDDHARGIKSTLRVETSGRKPEAEFSRRRHRQIVDLAGSPHDAHAMSPV